MSTAEIVSTIFVFALAGVFLIFGLRHFFEKGYLFHNAYIWAPKEEREHMNKSPYYRQTSIIFFMISIFFLITGISLVLKSPKIQYLTIPLMCLILVYAILSSIRIGKRERSNR